MTQGQKPRVGPEAQGQKMSKFLYSHDTSPSCAAQISADSGEIVHVQCDDRKAYALELLAIVDDYEESGGGLAETEITGAYDGEDIRIHLI